MDGIFLLDKASGISSARALAEVKRKFNLSRIGHAGTLDPMATGLLVCLSGAATRLQRFAQQGNKVYSGEIELGRTTTTDDVCGETLTISENVPQFLEVKRVVERYHGLITQTPPRVSAVKIAGERAYNLARRGVDFETTPRQVRIDYFKVEEREAHRFYFEVCCSGGTYIRSLARDIGRDLGCGGCLGSLRRLESYPFNVSAAKTIEQLELSDIQSLRLLLPNVPFFEFDGELVKKLSNGDEHSLATAMSSVGGMNVALYGRVGETKPLGVLEYCKGRWTFAANLV